MTREPVFFQGLIGKKIVVVESTNPQLIGLSGQVVDETKATLTLVTSDGKQKKVLKNSITFRLEDGKRQIRGLDVLRRPEERIKQ